MQTNIKDSFFADASPLRILLPRIRRWVFASALLTVSGCGADESTPTSLTGPGPSSGIDESFVALQEPYASAGCAFVATLTDGERIESIVPRTALPVTLPRTDRVPRTTRGSVGLKVITTQFPQRLSHGFAMVRFSCLAPLPTPPGRATHSIAMELGKLSPERFEKILRSYPVPEETRSRASRFEISGYTVRSSELLMASVSPSSARAELLPIAVKGKASPAGTTSISQFPPKPRFGEWYEEGLHYPEGPIDTLQTVVVYGSQPAVVDLSWIWEELGRRNFSISDWINAPEISIRAQQCDAANAGLDAALAALSAYEQDANDIDAAAMAVSNFMCEHSANLVGSNQTICIDFFIKGKTALLFMAGDERDYNANAPYTASRVQVYFDPNNPGATPTILYNSTVVLLPIPWADTLKNWGYGVQSVFTPFAHLPRDVSVRDSAGSIVVKVELYNGACKTLGSGWFARSACPAIDAKITMTRNGAGGWNVNFDRDAFPSVQVNGRPVGGAEWSEIAHSDEEHTRFAPLNLINLSWTHWDQRYHEAAAHFRLPPGCYRE